MKEMTIILSQIAGILSKKVRFSALSIWAKKVWVLTIGLFVVEFASLGQVNGDYQTRATGNWNTNTTWQVRSGGAWVNCAAGDYPGAAAGAGTVTILNGNNVTMANSPANSIGSLVISGGNTATTLTVGTYTLNVAGAITINPGTGTGDNKIISITSGTLNCASLTIAATTNNNRNSGITLSTGTVTVTGNISMGDVNDVFTFSGAGNLNVGGNMSGGTFTASTGTVNYNGVNQQVGAYTYNNLTMSGGGVKSLQGATTINGTLSLNSGILQLGNNNLTLANTTAIAGTFSNSNMIETNGTGFLIRTANANNNLFNGTYPVGNGSYYEPVIISGLTGVAAAARSLYVRSVPSNPAIFGNGINKYWDFTGTTNITGPVNVSLQYNIADATGNQATLQPYTNTSGSWVLATGASAAGVNPMISTGSATLTGFWTAGSPNTYYSYQSGDWDTALTWTTDPSGTLSVDPAIPGLFDNVVILNGRTVGVSANNKQIGSLEIRLGGYLDLASTSGHTFGTVTGQGVLRLSSGNFPTGTFTAFVAATGGTVEYYNLNNTRISNTQLTYNNLIVSNYTASANTVYLDNATNPINYTLNGNFDLKNNSSGSLTFNFGNPTASDNLINMTVNGNFTVSAGSNIRVNNFATGHAIPNPALPGAPSNYGPTALANYPVHTLYLKGNFTNNGSVRFTGWPSPVANGYYTATNTNNGTGTNYGHVQVDFIGASNNTLTCNGTTDFFRFIVEKGTDQTYTLDVVSSNTSNFGLYGPNYQGNNNFNGNPEGYGIGAYYKALFLHYGTIKLGANINIPSLTEGGQDYNLIPTAALWVNGANVSTTVSVANGTGYQAATLYGKLRISAGSFTTADAAGIVLGTLGTPEILIEGTGTFNTSQVWASAGTNIISYTQTGGTANFGQNAEYHGNAMLGLNSTNSVFNMSGGTINFNGNIGGNDFQLMNIAATSGNFKVTGGTININEPSSATVYTATSTVPFYHVNITNQTGTGTTTVQWAAPSPLTVLGNLNIGANSVLDLGTNTVSLNVAQNFTLTGTYTPGSNTTTFNGTGGQVFTNAGTIITGLNNLVLSNTSNTNITNNLTVLGSLTISSSCFLNDQGNNINVAGNITNSGTHTSQANGAIILNGGGAQTIGGNGSGVFGNLAVNKAAGTSTFSANQTVTGNVRLASGILDINRYNLTLSATSNVYDALAGTTAVFSNTKMINLSGLVSDGGITKPYNAIGSFVFPIGNASGYRPATIGFAQVPTTWGSVNVKLGARVHPLATSTNALKYYWKVVSTGFTGIPANSVSHTYHFINPGDINAGALANYVPGVYNPYAWTYINDVSQVNKINFNVLFTNVSYLDGEYTAGQPDAFGAVNIFYSRKNTGNWEDNDMWSTDPILKWAGAASGTFPGTDDIVIIGDGSTYNHTVNVTASNKTVGSLTINTGSTLDLGNTTGHNFGVSPDQKVIGSGTLKISTATGATATAQFPSGDFGNFLGIGGGTVEYYSTATVGATSITLPTTYNVGVTTVNITNYNNLNLNPASAKNVILPNTDLSIYNNLTANGAGLAELNTQNSTRTITVTNNLNVTSGKLEYINTNAAAQNNIIVNNDINVSSGATFDVAATNTATSNLTIQGNLVNNGTFNMRVGTPCNVTFTGAQNKGISGTGGTTNFNILTVNKGTDRNSVLDVTSSNFSLNTALATALTLTNGTFRLTSPLSITLTTSAAFTIPSSGCLSANGGTINIGQNNSTGADLLLQGRLEVLAGGVNIGLTTGATSDNDIEYASAGNPEIIVNGGTLLVNGQIRRNTSNTLGSLWYTQSGGTVTVRGLGTISTARGMFEVTNSGSQFNMSGGTLNIERSCGAAATFADAYITPATYNVTGGILQFGNTNTPAGQTFALNSSSSLGSVLIDGTTTNIVSLEVNPLTLVNDLTINGAASNIQCNGLNVTIGRNLTNNNTTNSLGTANGGYRPGSATQVTTFNGSSAASISGVAGNLTNFANLAVSKSATLTLSANSTLAVNTNLTLNSGTLADGGNTITVYGNIANYATHSSSAGNGIVLAGASEQIISGSGSGVFGNVSINNGNGVNMVDNTTINGTLTLTNGVFYIDDYKLSLGTSASVTTPTTFGTSRMIGLNGVISDQGIIKMFAGTSPAFTFPIGVSGKYTPATYTITSSNAGTLKLIPVNQNDPSETSPVGDELAYYWKVTTTGFSGLTAANQSYGYITSDVSGAEASYHGARYNGGIWTDFGTGAINTASTPHTINVSGAFLDGEYTAGLIANFGTVHPLYSLKSGNWNDPTVWAQDAPTNPTCNCYPSGNPVYIQPGHTITMNIDNAYAYSVDIPTTGVLDMADRLYSNLGFITGTGKMRLKGTAGGSYIFPGGNYDAFMTDPTGQSTVEFYGTITATLPLKPGNVYKPYQNVIFSDAGIKYMSAENMKVLKNLTINNGASLNNTLQNKNLYILGNWTDNNTVTSGFVPGTGLVSFEGTAAQQLTVVNNLTENFYDFRINNAAGLSITAGGGAGDVLVSDNLYLTSGVITTNTTNTFTMSNTSPSAAIGGGTSSYIDGPLYKAISSGSYFNFPVGNSGRYGNLYLSSASVAGIYTGQYFNAAPTYNVNSKLSPIDQVSNNEYWWVSGPATAQGNVQLRWDANSGFSSSTAASRSKIRAIEWNPTPGQWEYRGKVLNDGGPTSGTVQTDNIISLASGANLHYFTIGMESLPTATITSSLTPSVCNDGVNSTTVTVALTGTAPWSLTYKLGTASTTITNIASSPASIVLTSASAGISGTGTYNFNITNVNDAVGIPGVKDYTTTAVLTVKPVPTPAITGRTTVGTSEAGVAYSTPSVGGDTYTWTVTGGTIASGQNTAAIIVNWGAAAGTGTVSVTETNGAPNNCSITKSINVTIVNAPTPNVTGSANVCANEVGDVYYTPNIAGHTYSWTVTGGTFTGPTVVAGNNQIVVNWGAAGAGSVKVDETSGSTVSNTLNVTIYPLPSPTIPTVANTSICIGGSATLTVTNAEAATDYNLMNGATLVTTVHASTAGNYNFPAITPASTTTYSVQAVSQYGCKINLSSTPTVTVNLNTVNPALNIATPVSGTAICAGYNGPNATVTAGSGGGTGAADLYEYSLNNGSTWSNYTSGSTINTTGASTNVLIRISRSSGTGNGCNAMSATTIVTWPVASTPVAPILGTATPASGTVVCAGFNTGTVTGTAGTGGSSGAADSYRVSIDGGTTWAAYTSGNSISTTGATGNIIVQSQRSGGSYGCSAIAWGIISTWTLASAPVAPTLGTATPASGTTVCAGFSTGTVTGNTGTGGSSGATDSYRVSIDGGTTWAAYTSGNSISTTGATGNIIVQSQRSGGSYGCSATAWNTISTWTLASAMVAPTLGTATPASGTAICSGYNSGTVTITAGSGGSTGAADLYEYSINNGGAWNAYTSGNAITTTGATGNVLVRVSRSAGSYGCTATGPTTIVTWPVNAATVNPALNTATPASGTGICIGYNGPSATITAGSGGSAGATDTYQFSINNGGAWSAYVSGSNINTAGAATNVLIRVSRSAGSYGCTATGPTTIVTWPVNSLPTPTFSVQPGANACTNTDIIYTTQAGQSAYVWSVPGILNTDYIITSGGIGATNSTVTIKWLTTGSKTITVSYTDSNGCTAASPVSSTATTVTLLPVTGPVYRRPNN